MSAVRRANDDSGARFARDFDEIGVEFQYPRTIKRSRIKRRSWCDDRVFLPELREGDENARLGCGQEGQMSRMQHGYDDSGGERSRVGFRSNCRSYAGWPDRVFLSELREDGQNSRFGCGQKG